VFYVIRLIDVYEIGLNLTLNGEVEIEKETYSDDNDGFFYSTCFYRKRNG